MRVTTISTSRYIFLDKESLTYYDEDMGSVLELQLNGDRKRDKIFPHYDEHSYICNKNPPNTYSLYNNKSLFNNNNNLFRLWYYMTHLYVLKFYPLGQGLQNWVLW